MTDYYVASSSKAHIVARSQNLGSKHSTLNMHPHTRISFDTEFKNLLCHREFSDHNQSAYR
jgi:hypothetical protein